MASGFALVNAEVWTMKAPGDRAQAVVADGARIDFVGVEETALRRAKSLGVPVIDAGGARVLPGLIDSHTHLVHQGILPRRVDLQGVTSRATALRKVAAAARKARAGELVLAERFDDSQWTDSKEWPTKEELDAMGLQHPIVVRRIDGHAAVANREAVERVAAKLSGVDKQRGLLIEEASLDLHRVFPTPVPHATEAADDGQSLALSKGITSVHDFVHAHYLRGWQALDRRRKLNLRVTATPYLENLDDLVRLGLETRWGNDRLRLGGVKLFADGTIGARTAAVTKEYADDSGNLGRLNFSDEELLDHCDKAQDANLQISIHAIGDAAIDQVLRAYELLPKKDRTRLRHRIEHFEMGSPEQWAKAQELGVVLSMQPNFVGHWTAKDGMYAQRFGDQRHKATNPFRRLWDDGVPVAFGSDCMPLDPWAGIEAVVRAPWPAQRLKVEEALMGYTKNAATGLHVEKNRGTLEKGKWADLTVVKGDWRKPGGIAATKVLATAVGGAWVHEPRKLKRRT